MTLNKTPMKPVITPISNAKPRFDQTERGEVRVKLVMALIDVEDILFEYELHYLVAQFYGICRYFFNMKCYFNLQTICLSC